jgi:cysteine desulfuration protein SufE
MSLPTINDIIENLGFLEDWEDRYRYIIELGRMVDPMPEVYKTESNKVRGCASQVWLHATTTNQSEPPVLTFMGDSDAHIVRGLVALALALYSGKTAQDIIATDAFTLFSSLGLKEHLSAQRSNGFRSLIDKIQQEAALAMIK